MLSVILQLSLLAAPVGETGTTIAAPAIATPALEVNLVWPFLGISELKLLFPLVRRAEPTFRGELIAGLVADYGFGPITRPTDKYGKVLLLAGKVGWRQFLALGFHLDVSVNLGWRHEEFNVWDGGTVDGFTGRLWLHGGWQTELTSRVYLNVRGSMGVHLFRTDRFGDKERLLAFGGDLNVGVRF